MKIVSSCVFLVSLYAVANCAPRNERKFLGVIFGGVINQVNSTSNTEKFLGANIDGPFINHVHVDGENTQSFPGMRADTINSVVSARNNKQNFDGGIIKGDFTNLVVGKEENSVTPDSNQNQHFKVNFDG